MRELASLGEVLLAVLTMACGLGYPPFSTGAFWAIAAAWGIISVIFDDESARGVPGLEEVRDILQHRHEAHHDRR
jgi:hypothetical protein